MKKGILLIVAALLCTSSFVQAEEELGVEFDATWVSKYIWRGFDLLDDKAAFQPSFNFDLYDTGFSLNIWTSYAGSAGFSSTLGGSRVDATEYDYTIAYNHTLYGGESYATDIMANWIYYDFIDAPTRASDTQEIGVGFTWPNICPTGVVPSYYVGKIWPSRSNSTLTGEYGGWLHVLGLGYDLIVPGFLLDMPEQTVSLSASMVYNDGFAGAGVDHDWSHAVFGVSSDFEVTENLVFTPGLYYQSSWEDSVNTEDEAWVSLSMKYRF